MSSYRIYECVSAMEEVSLLELIGLNELSSRAPPFGGEGLLAPSRWRSLLQLLSWLCLDTDSLSIVRFLPSKMDVSAVKENLVTIVS